MFYNNFYRTGGPDPSSRVVMVPIVRTTKDCLGKLNAIASAIRSKRINLHDAHIVFLKSIYNLTKENERFRVLEHPNAKRSEMKYKKVSPAMKQGLVNEIYLLKDLLLMKPLMFAIN